jgi:cation-transporting ATPase 13A2
MYLNELHKIEREAVECDLNFLGLILMQNKVKSDTKQVIDDLNRNNIKSVMVTGDNPLTAISVARQCGMVPKSRVFLGSVTNNNLVWRDIDSDDTLNATTLMVIIIHDTNMIAF